jgi:hypothetical protein
MQTFITVHQKEIIGQMTMFDRMIFRGHLTNFYPQGAFQRFLSSQGILLKQFGKYVQTMSGILKEHAKKIAEQAGREFIYLTAPTTKATGKSKEDLAREIASRQGISEGLICVFSVLEPCMSFQVRGNRETQKLEVVRAQRKCLHFYFYLIDREFGFMHVRLQSWFPFQIQLYINGREWLARQMDCKGIGYRRYENSFLRIDELSWAQSICQKLVSRKWVRVLDAFARWVNPLLPLIRQVRFGSYWWVLDQAEIATDIMFDSRSSVAALVPEVLHYAMSTFSCEDVMRFLGRKLHGNFQGQLTSDLKRRPEGYRVKHRMKGNSLKVYDKWSVLRVETTITQPRQFKVLRVVRLPKGKLSRQWKPMGKGVANLWRYYQVGLQANRRYLEALAQVTQRGKAVKELDSLCRPVVKDGRRYAKLQPLSGKHRAVFRAVLSADRLIHGVRNKDVRATLYGSAKASPQEDRRRCARVSRILRTLRGHRLIYRVRNSNLYRVTHRGHRIMSSVLLFHQEQFAEGYAMAS